MSGFGTGKKRRGTVQGRGMIVAPEGINSLEKTTGTIVRRPDINRGKEGWE